MDSASFVLMSGALTFGVPLLLAVRELFALRGDGGDGGRPRRPVPEAPPPPPAPTAGKRLPDCLLPKPLPRPAARPRVLEDA